MKANTIWINERTGVVYILKAILVSSKGALTEDMIYDATVSMRRNGSVYYKQKLSFNEGSFFNEACFCFEVHFRATGSRMDRLRCRLSMIKAAALIYMGINTVRIIVA
ncbi:MAG: hypothetical protein ACRCZM_11665 [Bacteroidales bacterium]